MAKTKQTTDNPQPDHKHTKTSVVINRLSRIEGHVRAIKRMIEEEKPCPEVLIQLAAVRSAIEKTSRVVLEDHINTCLSNLSNTSSGGQEWYDLKSALDKYIH